MKKFLETSFGSRRVDTPAIRTVFENLIAIYDDFQQLMENSAYITTDKNGRKVRQTFPISMSDVNSLKEKFKAEKRHYIRLQTSSMNENPDDRNRYYSKEKSLPSYLPSKAIDNCWPNTKNDVLIRSITDKIDQISALANLRKKSKFKNMVQQDIVFKIK